MVASVGCSAIAAAIITALASVMLSHGSVVVNAYGRTNTAIPTWCLRPRIGFSVLLKCLFPRRAVLAWRGPLPWSIS